MSLYALPVLDPAHIPEIALDSMNQTHKEEVEIINQLGELLEQGLSGSPDIEAITAKLFDWVAHTREHFRRENDMMQEYGFFAMQMHSSEHARVLQQIELIQKQWLKSQLIEPLADYIFNEWPQWFENHVNSMDMVTAQFLSQAMK